jgi:hypothetical protein
MGSKLTFIAGWCRPRLDRVFLLYDEGSGLAGPVRPARPGELRIWVASGAASPPAQLAGLRSCVTADLVRRVAERHNLRVSAWQQAPGGEGTGDDAARALRAAWDELNIHPAELAAEPPQPLDVAVAGAGQPGGSPAHRLQPGEVLAGEVLAGEVLAGEVLPWVPGLAGLHPLALRMAFLEHKYREPVQLTREALEAADQALRDWRGLVAGWARSPSKPMCAQYTGDVLGAFDDDLDTPAALRALRALAADGEIPPGSKFESFAYLDQLLGLDLASEVGR